MIILFCFLLAIGNLLNACDSTQKITEKKETACTTITTSVQDKNLFLNYVIPEELIVKYFYIYQYKNNSSNLKKHFLNYCIQKKQNIIPMPPCAQVNKSAKEHFEKNYLSVAEHYVELHFLDNIIFLINDLSIWHYRVLQGALFQSVYQLDNFFQQYKNRAPLKTILKNEIKKIENIPHINTIKEPLSQHIAAIRENLTLLNNQAANILQNAVRDINHSTQDIQSLFKASNDYVIYLKKEIAENQKHIANIKFIMNDYNNQKTTSIKNYNDTLNLCIEPFCERLEKAQSQKKNYDNSYSDNIVSINNSIKNIDDLLETNRDILDCYEVNTHYKTIDDLHKILEKLEKISKRKKRFNGYVKNALLGLIVNVFADYHPIAYQKIFLPKNIVLPNDQSDIDCPIIIQNFTDESTYQQTELGHANQDVSNEKYADFEHIYCAFLRLILLNNKSNELKKITSSKQIAEEIGSCIKLTLPTPLLYQMKALAAKQAVFFNPDPKEFLPQVKGIKNPWLLKDAEIIITKKKRLSATLKNIYIKGQAREYLHKPIKFYTEEGQYIIPITIAIIKNIIANNDLKDLLPNNQKYYLYLSNLTKKHRNDKDLAKKNIDYINQFLKNYKIIPLITTEKLLNVEECKEENVDAARKFYEEMNIGVKIKEWHNILKEIVEKKLYHIDHFFIPTEGYDLDNTYDTIDFICKLFKKVSINYCNTYKKQIFMSPENLFYKMPTCLNNINFLDAAIKNIDWSQCKEIKLSLDDYQYVLAKKDFYINQLPKHSNYTLNNTKVNDFNFFYSQDRDEFFNPIALFKFILAKSMQNNILTLNLSKTFCKNINKILNIKTHEKEIESALQPMHEQTDTVYIKSFLLSSYYDEDNKKLNFLLLKPWGQIIFESKELGINIVKFLDHKLCNNKKIVIKYVDTVILDDSFFESNVKKYIDYFHDKLIHVDWSACKKIKIEHFFLNSSFHYIIDIIRLSNNVPCTIIFNRKHYQKKVLMQFDSEVSMQFDSRVFMQFDSRVFMQFSSNDTCKDIITKNNLFIINDDQATLLPWALEIIHTLFLMGFDQTTILAALKECIFENVTAIHIPKATYYTADIKDSLLLLCKLFQVIDVDKQHCEYDTIINTTNSNVPQQKKPTFWQFNIPIKTSPKQIIIEENKKSALNEILEEKRINQADSELHDIKNLSNTLSSNQQKSTSNPEKNIIKGKIRSEKQNNPRSTNSLINNALFYYPTKIISILSSAGWKIITTPLYYVNFMVDYIINLLL